MQAKFLKQNLFQFTPLREGRRQNLTPPRSGKMFQFTPLREGRRRSYRHQRSDSACFNSRPCVRGDLSFAGLRALQRLFQFTPLREGRRSCCRICKQNF